MEPSLKRAPSTLVPWITSLCWRITWSIIFYTILFFFFNLFIYFWLCWVFVSVRGLSPVAASGGHSSSRCAGLSLSRPLLLRSTGSRHAGSVVVAHGPSCSAACGIFSDQGLNPCPLHWQADSQPLRHQGSPWSIILHPRTPHQAQEVPFSERGSGEWEMKKQKTPSSATARCQEEQGFVFVFLTIYIFILFYFKSHSTSKIFPSAVVTKIL